MPHTQLKPPYSVFAKYYDQIAAPLRAPNLRAREKVLLPRLRPESRSLPAQAGSNPEPRVFCDLCCGTGTTALEFARRGFRAYAVDGSRDMLKIARAKFAAAGVRVETIHADMRTFRLPETVDLITCEFDAINHVKKKQDLKAVAQSVARALKPRGLFFFDANTQRAFEKLWVNNWIQEGDGFFMAARGGYDAKSDKGWTEWNWFLPQTVAPLYDPSADGRSQTGATASLLYHYVERYEEVAWTQDEITSALSSAGLRVRGCWDLVRFAAGASWAMPGCRYFWLAEKNRV